MRDEFRPIFPHVLSQSGYSGRTKVGLDSGILLTHRYPSTMSDLVAHVDGSCLGSPGPAGIGVIIRGAQDDPITVAKWIGRQDNNVAEYMALLEALQCAV